jgi:hypothetical protein
VTIVVPSYLAKIDRAQQHLQDLDVEVANYVNSKPYRVGTRYEGSDCLGACRTCLAPALLFD